MNFTRRLRLHVSVAFFATAGMASGCGLSWSPSVEDALANAQASKRLAVVVFTGSDWSPRSFKLDEEVLMNAEFAERFERYFALTNADFPQRTPPAPQVLASNTAAATKYQIKAWPTLLALRPDGTEFARIEFSNQPVAQLIETIDQWESQYAREHGQTAGAAAPVLVGDIPAEVVEQRFSVRGVVKSIPDNEPGAVVIEHEEIPGYMEAMTMKLRARNHDEIKPLRAGDHIAFRLNVTAKQDWIDEIRVTAAGKVALVPKEPAPLKPIEAGQPLPEAVLVNERNEALKLSDYRGQAVAITFIYTRCPLPTFCPLLNRNFQETHQLLSADPAGPKNWRLLSITIDPERDRPEVLAGLATGLKADPARWRFATGTLKEITTLAQQCGLNFWDDRGLIQHNLRTLVVAPNGQVRRVLAENAWTPAQLAAELSAAAKIAEK